MTIIEALQAYCDERPLEPGEILTLTHDIAWPVSTDQIVGEWTDESTLEIDERELDAQLLRCKAA